MSTYLSHIDSTYCLFIGQYVHVSVRTPRVHYLVTLLGSSFTTPGYKRPVDHFIKTPS